MRNIEYDDSVFINCPFDEAYTPMMVAVIYAVYGSGFFPRSALEEDNGLQNRLDKIQKIIENCRYGIHDICRVELNENKLPRFNMPFELGLFFGAKRFGDSKQQLKNALIFDTEAHRYEEYISDIKGVDIKAHGNNALIVVEKICNWLKTASRRRTNQEYKKYWMVTHIGRRILTIF
jgi:hypothetical protein